MLREHRTLNRMVFFKFNVLLPVCATSSPGLPAMHGAMISHIWMSEGCIQPALFSILFTPHSLCLQVSSAFILHMFLMRFAILNYPFSCFPPSARNWLSVHGGVLRVKMPMCLFLLLWANPQNTISDPNMCNFFKEGQDHQGINEPWASWRSKSLSSAFSLHHWQEWQQPLWGLFHLFPCLPAAWRLVLGRGRVPLPGRAALRGCLRPHWAACAWGGTWGGQQMKSRQLKGLVREDTELMLCAAHLRFS